METSKECCSIIWTPTWRMKHLSPQLLDLIVTDLCVAQFNCLSPAAALLRGHEGVQGLAHSLPPCWACCSIFKITQTVLSKNRSSSSQLGPSVSDLTRTPTSRSPFPFPLSMCLFVSPLFIPLWLHGSSSEHLFVSTLNSSVLLWYLSSRC